MRVMSACGVAWSRWSEVQVVLGWVISPAGYVVGVSCEVFMVVLSLGFVLFVLN